MIVPILSFLLLQLLTITVHGNDAQDSLDTARALWSEELVTYVDSSSDPINYNYAYRLNGAETHSVSVRNKTQVKGISLTVPDSIVEYYTVEALFDKIQNVIASAGENATVTYDKYYGFPTDWSFYNINNTTTTGNITLFTFYTAIRSKIDTNYATWNSQPNITENYDFTMRLDGFLPQEFTEPKQINVRNGAIVQVTNADGTIFDRTQFSYPTIEEAFATIERSLDKFYGYIFVQFDETLGYPTTYTFQQDIFMSDGPPGYTISNVVAATDQVGNNNDDQQALLTANKALFASHNISEYHFGLRKDCFCVFRDAITVQVKDGMVTKMQSRYGEELTENDTYYSFSIEDIFDLIQQGIDQQFESLSAEYDPVYGYPTKVNLDPEFMVADDEFDLIIDYFAPLSEWQQELNVAKSTWESQGLETYNYIFQKSCECIQEDMTPKLVEVISNNIVSVDGVAVIACERAVRVRTAGGGCTPPTNVPPTPNELLYLIQEALTQNAFRVDVTYDSIYGFPSSLVIDYEEMMADEELIVSITLENDKATETPGTNNTLEGKNKALDSGAAVCNSGRSVAILMMLSGLTAFMF